MVLSASQNSDGVEILYSPEGSLTSGRHTQMQAGVISQTPSGEQYLIGATIDVIPKISEDGQSVQMVMVAQLNLRTQTPPNQ